MKILFHSWEFGQGTGGIGQYLYQIAKGIHEFGHEVIVVAGKTRACKEKTVCDFGTVYRLIEKQEIHHSTTSDLVLRLAASHHVDFIEGADHLGECAGLLEHKARPKVIIKYHGCQIIKALTSAEVIYPWQRFTVAAALWRIRGQRQLERKCVERADAAMYPSEKIKQDFQEQGSVLPTQLRLIPNMLSNLPTIRENEESKAPTILFVGRIEIRKGIQYLPGIFSAITKQFPNVVLEIAGGDQYARGLGSLKNWLQKKLGNLNDRVRFLGAIDPVELDKAYRRSWLLVFPTKWDNFPMAVLEAMSYGKPIVTTYNGGMPEMLKNTGSPVHDPMSDVFADSIIRLLHDTELRQQIGYSCRKRVIENYMPEQVIPQYLSYLEQLM